MRLIDAEKLIDELEKIKSNISFVDAMFICGVQAIIDDLPDAITHAHWINRNGNVVYPDSVQYECSNCKGHGFKTIYCPHCGAKMDEVTANES